ncbi:hypothetical protein [Paraburkholderia azotifigens]|uniref:Protein-tyrosine-phosphatase n=1 Tax=Paraburkholderia azotifigens TaxID=2057004 RepID=A0ABU9QY46_9BURK|nr:hypothetical protein [Paraburkholderia azotifigens]
MQKTPEGEHGVASGTSIDVRGAEGAWQAMREKASLEMYQADFIVCMTNDQTNAKKI